MSIAPKLLNLVRVRLLAISKGQIKDQIRHRGGAAKRAKSYGAGGLKPESQKQFIIFGSIINLVQGGRASFLCAVYTIYLAMNRFSPFRLNNR